MREANSAEGNIDYQQVQSFGKYNPRKSHLPDRKLQGEDREGVFKLQGELVDHLEIPHHQWNPAHSQVGLPILRHWKRFLRGWPSQKGHHQVRRSFQHNYQGKDDWREYPDLSELFTVLYEARARSVLSNEGNPIDHPPNEREYLFCQEKEEED